MAEAARVLAARRLGLDLGRAVPGAVDDSPAVALAEAPVVLACRHGDELRAVAGLSPLTWDTAKAGMPLGEVSVLAWTDDEARGRLVTACVDAAADEGWHRVQHRESVVSGAELGLMERHGFRAIDALVTFAVAVRPGARSPEPDLGPLREDELEAACDIAGRCFAVSRFHSDELFAGMAGALHAEWLRNSAVHGLADRVLVLREAGAPAAFVTVKKRSAGGRMLGRIVLLGVDPERHGRGLGRRLVDGTLAWMAEEGLAGCIVGTQAYNLPAVNLYASRGLTVVGFQRTLVKDLRRSD